jgi:hypothetical protein
MIRSGNVRWEGHVAHMREMTIVYRILVSDLKGRDHIANRVIDGGWRIMLK